MAEKDPYVPRNVMLPPPNDFRASEKAHKNGSEITCVRCGFAAMSQRHFAKDKVRDPICRDKQRCARRNALMD